MRISKSHLVDPNRNGAYGTFAVALSFFVFAYSTKFGQLSILAYYGVWFLLIFADYRRVLGNYTRYGWILAFPLLCFVSAFWSPAFGVSLRVAIQYLTHIICALAAMRTISTMTLMRGAIIGTVVVLIYSILFGTYQLDAMDGTFSFVGAFESKNQLGFYASLGVFFAYVAVMVMRPGPIWIAGAGVAGLLSAYCLLASQSATSVITTFAVVAGCIGMQAFMFFPPKSRRGIFAAAIVIGTATIIAALQFGAIDAVLGMFGKDTTLTGRTYLWQQGIEAAHEHPVLGLGYQGFWVIGSPWAEKLWADFAIAGKTGFHFHNTYIEITVENGLVGVSLMIMILLGSFIGHLRRLLMIARTPDSLVMFGIATLLMVRSFVEIDILFPYQIGSFLFYFVAGKLTLGSNYVFAKKPDRMAERLTPAAQQAGARGMMPVRRFPGAPQAR